MNNEFDNSENQNNAYNDLYNNYGKENHAETDSVNADENGAQTSGINNSSMNAGTTGSNSAASGNYYGNNTDRAGYSQNASTEGSSTYQTGDSSYSATGNTSGAGNTYSTTGNTYGAAGNTYGTAGNTYGAAGNTYGAAGNTYGAAGNTYGSTDKTYSSQGSAYSTSGSSYNAGNAQNNGSAFNKASGQGADSNQKKGFFSKKSGNGGNNKGPGNNKKSGGFFKKAVALVMSAVLFGAVAGGTMLGVQAIGKKTGVVAEETSGTQIKIAETTKSDSTTSSSSSDSGLGDVSGVVEKVLPSVVAITNSQVYENYSSQYGNDWSNFFNYYFGGGSDGYGSYGNGNSNGNSSNGSSSDDSSEEVVTGSGSGIIIGQNDTEILIVTNYHVIEDADSLTITFCDDTTAKASVKGTDEDNDLAVVAVKTADLEDGTADNIAIATLDTKDDCKVGQGVIAIGNALGYGQSITVGYISALDRSVTTSEGTTKNLLQTDAAINPGNSGGALINSDGEIIGINSAKYSDTDVEGMGFAIPISKVYDIIDDLMNQETKVEVAENQRGYLGINASTVDSTTAKTYGMPEGVYVYSIAEGGAASKSDLQAYDIITKIDSTSVSTKEELIEALKYYAIGDTVTLTVSRNTGNGYEEMEIKVTLEAQVS